MLIFMSSGFDQYTDTLICTVSEVERNKRDIRRRFERKLIKGISLRFPWDLVSDSADLDSRSHPNPPSVRPINQPVNMPKLYYTAHSCGAANFLSAHIAGIHLDTELVDIGNHTTASGVDFYTINPKGNVPTIVLDDGTVLNENGATLTWIADQVC